MRSTTMRHQRPSRATRTAAVVAMAAALAVTTGCGQKAGVAGTLAGSGGGKWLDISGTGLAQVGYIRFSVADDMNVESRLSFELDAVSISHGAVGRLVVPETAAKLSGSTTPPSAFASFSQAVESGKNA